MLAALYEISPPGQRKDLAASVVNNLVDVTVDYDCCDVLVFSDGSGYVMNKIIGMAYSIRDIKNYITA